MYHDWRPPIETHVTGPGSQWLPFGKLKSPRLSNVLFITAEKGGVARAKGVKEKEKECTTGQEPTAPWALNYGSGEGGDATLG